eukprot:CAMPEP_0178441644 /NCGR_PEP_ID=MMETSP0689_2-20121128/37602_1 /TAXON_ID=160604 /ORGANISM="Amphidinium massartii, Strain CS-259" /LENGTH=150 /DNA_ID=CAMNT_0020064859 /DNA_START=129 /DNA_END=578 /DNA_ORIENTATION=+
MVAAHHDDSTDSSAERSPLPPPADIPATPQRAATSPQRAAQRRSGRKASGSGVQAASRSWGVTPMAFLFSSASTGTATGSSTATQDCISCSLRSPVGSWVCAVLPADSGSESEEQRAALPPQQPPQPETASASSVAPRRSVSIASTCTPP